MLNVKCYRSPLPIVVFLVSVLRTLLTRVSRIAQLEANNEAMHKQAVGAGDMNKMLLEENGALKKVFFF